MWLEDDLNKMTDKILHNAQLAHTLINQELKITAQTAQKHKKAWKAFYHILLGLISYNAEVSKTKLNSHG